METKAILRITGIRHNLFIDLYLPEDVWKKLVKQLNSNRLTVVLRMLHEYRGDLKIEEEMSK